MFFHIISLQNIWSLWRSVYMWEYNNMREFRGREAVSVAMVTVTPLIGGSAQESAYFLIELKSHEILNNI